MRTSETGRGKSDEVCVVVVTVWSPGSFIEPPSLCSLLSMMLFSGGVGRLHRERTKNYECVCVCV